MADLLTIDEILKGKRPVTVPVTIIRDTQLVRDVQAARKALEAVQRTQRALPDSAKDPAAVEAAQAALDDAEAALEDGRWVFRFRNISRRDFERLRTAPEHQPTAAQQADARARGQHAVWNLATFPPALLAACAVEPQMTLEQATELWNSDGFNDHELDLLFSGALAAQTSEGIAALGEILGKD